MGTRGGVALGWDGLYGSGAANAADGGASKGGEHTPVKGCVGNEYGDVTMARVGDDFDWVEGGCKRGEQSLPITQSQF